MQTASSLLVLSVFLVSVKGCPSGWLRHEDKCYHFSHDTETWLGAIDMCKLLGGKIVEIETATENAYLAANAKLQNKWYWVGLTDVQEESVWIWIESKQKLADVGFKHWDVNEPSNSGSDENCAILRTNGFWNDYRCATPGHYICETDNEDPVKLYELYVRRRPIAMMTPDSPFYLTPIPIARLTPGNKTEAWYYPRPMGQNTLGTLLKEAATTAGVQKRITNHSVRKTTVSTLSRAGVPPQKIMKITGHKNIQSITHYDAELNENEHRNINKILQTSATTMDKAQTVTPNNPFTGYARPLVDSTNISSHTVSSEATPQIPKQLNPYMSGSCFYNCTFNF